MKNIYYFFAKYLLGVVFLISPGILLAQNKPMKFQGNKTEQKADKINYNIYEQVNHYTVFNKINSLMVYETSFITRFEHSPFSAAQFVYFHDREKIDALVYKIIAPHLRDYKSKHSDTTTSFEIFLISKPDGKICELSFVYLKDPMIPLKAIEKLESEILALDLQFTFNESAYEPVIKDALWVYFPVYYSAASMKEKLNKENK